MRGWPERATQGRAARQLQAWSSSIQQAVHCSQCSGYQKDVNSNIGLYDPAKSNNTATYHNIDIDSSKKNSKLPDNEIKPMPVFLMQKTNSTIKGFKNTGNILKNALFHNNNVISIF